MLKTMTIDMVKSVDATIKNSPCEMRFGNKCLCVRGIAVNMLAILVYAFYRVEAIDCSEYELVWDTSLNLLTVKIEGKIVFPILKNQKSSDCFLDFLVGCDQSEDAENEYYIKTNTLTFKSEDIYKSICTLKGTDSFSSRYHRYRYGFIKYLLTNNRNDPLNKYYGHVLVVLLFLFPDLWRILFDILNSISDEDERDRLLSFYYDTLFSSMQYLSIICLKINDKKDLDINREFLESIDDKNIGSFINRFIRFGVAKNQDQQKKLMEAIKESCYYVINGNISAELDDFQTILTNSQTNNTKTIVNDFIAVINALKEVIA